MIENLDYFQTRLEQHFNVLAQSRRDRGLPVFALEHGLDQDERNQIASLLRVQLRNTGPVGKHWLIWVVYAAELGYDYDGAEYWPSFENRTPLWAERADRRQLRGWFTRFHDKYAGLKPTGAWAQWFSIIAWPITHALLPKDLQTQLAQTLYSLRYQLSARIEEGPAAIGRYVEKSSSDGSSRFRNFLEQEEIAGRVILALLGGRSDEVQQSIHPLTLERIVKDLEQTRNAREWLRDARRAVETVQMRGAASSLGAPPPGRPSDVVVQKAKAPTLSVSPRVMLRRTGENEWIVILELPSFREVADMGHEIGQFLRQRRCTVSGSVGTLPAGWLLGGRQRRVLSSWPANDEPLVRFDRINPLLEHLLQSEVRLTTGPRWLFRIGADGLAHEVIGRAVRAGTGYIVVSRSPLPSSSLFGPTSINCDGIFAQQIVLPEHLDASQIVGLRAIGLSIAQSIRIWPVGLAARSWDGEGFSEWLEGEAPCFALDHDHPIEKFEVFLDNQPVLRLPAARPGVATFFELSPLRTGRHTLHVRAIGVPDVVSQTLSKVTDGYVALSVRAPRPWISGTIGHSGLVVTADPVEPTIDQFWEGAVRLQAFGPIGRQVNLRIELLDGGGGNLASEAISTLPLPVAVESWGRTYTTFLRKDRDPWAYLAASSGNLVIEGDDLGAFRIALRHTPTPLRWVWHKTNRATELRLVDDHQADEPLDVRFFPFSHPASPIVLESRSVISGYSPPTPGGLCVASYGQKRQALVVSVSAKDRGLSGLLIDPDQRDMPCDDASVKVLVGFVSLWSSARLTGPLAAERRERVVRGLRQQVFRILCGDHWATAEAAFLNSARGSHDLRRLGQCVGGAPAFASVLVRDADEIRRMTQPARLQHYIFLAERYGLSAGDACKAALEFCQSVAAGVLWDQAATDRCIADMRRSPEVIRGARLLMLAWSESHEKAKLEKNA
jgi:hypothetical protein